MAARKRRLIPINRNRDGMVEKVCFLLGSFVGLTERETAVYAEIMKTKERNFRILQKEVSAILGLSASNIAQQFTALKKKKVLTKFAEEIILKDFFIFDPDTEGMEVVIQINVNDNGPSL